MWVFNFDILNFISQYIKSNEPMYYYTNNINRYKISSILWSI